MLGDGSMSKYQDMIEFKSYDQRVLSSQFLDDQGIWRPFMKAVYTRKKS